MAMTPEVSDLVNKIKTEQSASKMRGYIADGLQSTNEKAVSTDGRQDALSGEFDNLGTQFQNVIEETTEKDFTSAPEIIVARKDKPNLNARLDSFETETTAQFQQNNKLNNQGSSLVNKLLNHITSKSIYVSKEIGGVNIGINVKDDISTVLEYNFKYNADGLLLLRGAKTGKAIEQSNPSVVLKGTFNELNPPSVYTTTIGDGFSFEFIGTGFDFTRLTESRGGMWEFILDDGRTRKISCYQEVGVTTKTINVFDNLKKRKYVVTASFIGNDLTNAPSATPARGYLRKSTANELIDFPIKVIDDCSLIDQNSSKKIISSNSIPDFAIAGKPFDKPYSTEWVPAHSVAGVSENIKMKFIVDGNTVLGEINAPLKTDFFDVEKIQITQTFEANNPNGSDGAMWDHFVTHFISLDKPFLEISNRLKFKKKSNISNMYLAMLPVVSDSVSRLVLNNGTEYETIPKDGSTVNLKSDVSSAMFAGTYEPGRTHACAIDVGSYAESVGTRKSGENNTPSIITFRADNVAKFYLNAKSGIVEAGEVFQNTQRIVCASGIKYPNDLVKSI